MRVNAGKTRIMTVDTDISVMQCSGRLRLSRH